MQDPKINIFIFLIYKHNLQSIYIKSFGIKLKIT